MESSNKRWLDAIIIVLMVLLVYALCQPIGRKWNRYVEEAYTGDEGVFAHDVDTYYYLRRAKEFTQNGFSSIRIMYSRTEDPLITAVRTGTNDSLPNLLSAMAATLWYILHFLGSKVGIYSLAIRFCAGILALCTIPVYLFVRKRMSRLSGIVAGLFITLAPPFFKHSFAGFFDTDALICIFALIMILSSYECVLRRNVREKCLYGAAALLGVVLLAFTWKVFFVYVVIAVGTAVFAMIVVRMWAKKDNKLCCRVSLLIFALMILLTLFLGWEDIGSSIVSLFQREPVGEPWPSTSKYVAEMDKLYFLKATYFWDIFMATNVDYISYLGGVFSFVFLLGTIVVSVILLFRNRNVERGIEACDNLFLFAAVASWGLGTLVMTLFGIRFMEFFVLPAGIIIAYGVSLMERYLSRAKHSLFTRRIGFVCAAILFYAILVYAYPVASLVVACVLLVGGFFISRYDVGRVFAVLLAGAILLSNMAGAYLTTSLSFPYVERPLEESMKWIRDNTPKDAVVANFWDLGYVYQYYSERRTISDGGTYSGEFFYWLGTMMVTPDLKLTAGIIRMLQNSGLDGTDYACELLNSKSKACDMLKEILPLSRQLAEEKLIEYAQFTKEQRTKLLDYTHPENCPEIYFVTFYNLFRLAATLDYYYSWDFTGNTVAKGSVLLGNSSVELPTENQKRRCEVWNKGYEYGYSVLLSAGQEGTEGCFLIGNDMLLDFPRTIYIKDGAVLSDRIKEESEDRDMLNDEILIIIEENERLSVVVCPDLLADSALFRLYLFDGIGQDVFTKVFDREVSEELSQDVSKIQRRIGTARTRNFVNCGNVVWKVNFD